MALEPEPTDLLNPIEVREHVLPRAVQMLAQKREKFQAAQREAEQMLVAPKREVLEWESKVSALRTLAGVSASSDEDSTAAATTDGASSDKEFMKASSMQDLVVEVLNREARKLRSRDVRDILLREGHDVTTESVSNALYYAAAGDKIRKLEGRGWYSPLSYTETVIFDSRSDESPISAPRAV